MALSMLGIVGWPPRDTPMGPHALRTFVIATFALSWGVGILLTVFPGQATALLGPMSYTNPAFILIVCTPGIVAVAMVLRHYGVRGSGPFFRRLLVWRMSVRWWLVLLLGVPAVFYVGATIKGTVGDFPLSPWYAVFPALVPALLIGPIEELGWRGVALPLLQRRLAPLWASLVLGVIVAVWHIPSFFMGGTLQSGWELGPFLLGIVALSVILTAMFNASRGSLLVAFVFHAQINGPAWPDAQPWDSYLLAAIAVVVVVVHRRAMLSREAGVTGVLLDEGTGAAAREPEAAPLSGVTIPGDPLWRRR